MILTGIFIILAVGGVIFFLPTKVAQRCCYGGYLGHYTRATFSEVVQATSLYQSKEFKIEYKQKT